MLQEEVNIKFDCHLLPSKITDACDRGGGGGGDFAVGVALIMKSSSPSGSGVSGESISTSCWRKHK